MALPIWAYARGKLYPTVVFQDVDTARRLRRLQRRGTRSAFTSPARRPIRSIAGPMMATEIRRRHHLSLADLQQLEGALRPDAAQSYYPPRNDLGGRRPDQSVALHLA